MAQIDSNILSLETDIINANRVKDLVLEKLYKEGYIKEEIAMEYAETWQIIIIKNNWFKNWCEKYEQKKDVYSYQYVKLEK